MIKYLFGAMGTLALSGCAEMAAISFDDINAAAGLSRDNNNRVVSIYNRTGVTMTRFYGSSSNDSSWGDDRLGTSVMYSGQSWRMVFDDGSGACLYDLKAEFADGDVLVSNGVNVCVVSEWGWQ